MNAPEMPQVALTSTWYELLPKEDVSARRARWAAWLRLARPVMGRGIRIWAGRQERCRDCAHSRGGWCCLQCLPCAFNPCLTPRTGMSGMACMGLGFQPRQLDLNLGAISKREAR